MTNEEDLPTIYRKHFERWTSQVYCKIVKQICIKTQIVDTHYSRKLIYLFEK